uniref:Spliceosome-associated protein CWC27 homolog n=1 Tax=Oncorhynchus kisutch TaxID=8019 RepID=A0A8C7F8X6_ONCKI
MSNIYIQEPPSNGNVSANICSPVKISFHRVVPEFIVQGGDPTGTWTVESPIYGRQFKVNLHCLVAMANAMPHDNGSQFFFTLARADELNNKHTIFGKVKRQKKIHACDTMYNMLRLAEVECDQEERHLNPHKLRTTDVWVGNFSLLSFGEEAEEEEEMDDPLLSSVPTVNKSVHEDVVQTPCSAASTYLILTMNYIHELIYYLFESICLVIEGEKPRCSWCSIPSCYLLNQDHMHHIIMHSIQLVGKHIFSEFVNLSFFLIYLGWPMFSSLMSKPEMSRIANMQDEDTFEIYDPRNPVNKRRREEEGRELGLEVNPGHVTDQASLLSSALTHHFKTTVSPSC